MASIEIVQEIDRQWRELLRVRAFFPTIGNSSIGASEFSTPPFYQQFGHHVRVSLAQPLTHSQADELNQVGAWLNESYVVRLCALLEHRDVIPKEGRRIDTSLAGHREIDVLRRLRNELVHRSGRYNPDDVDSRRLFERMVTEYGIQTESLSEVVRYPVHINTFLLPMTEGCKTYARGCFPAPCSESERSGG